MTIEIHQLVDISNEIRRNGTAKPAHIGVSAAPPEDTDDRGGLAITDVEDDSPAQIAGLHIGDRLMVFSGEPVDHPRDLFFVLRGLAAGQTVSAEIMRGNERISMDITLGER